MNMPQTSESFSAAVSGNDDAAVDVLSLAVCLVQRDRVQDNRVVQKRRVLVSLRHNVYG